MRKLTEISPSIFANQNKQTIPLNGKRINCQISQPLLIKCQNLITSLHLAHNYSYSSLSDLIRKSLTAYSEKKLNLTIPRPVGQPKKIICLALPFELWEYYRNLPFRHRTNILESCLVNYINTI